MDTGKFRLSVVLPRLGVIGTSSGASNPSFWLKPANFWVHRVESLRDLSHRGNKLTRYIFETGPSRNHPRLDIHHESRGWESRWNSIVGAYSKPKLNQEDDKLVAISGLVQRIHEVRGFDWVPSWSFPLNSIIMGPDQCEVSYLFARGSGYGQINWSQFWRRVAV